MINQIVELVTGAFREVLRIGLIGCSRFLRWVWETNDRWARIFGVGGAAIAIMAISSSLPLRMIGGTTIASGLVALVVIYGLIATLFGGSRYR